MAISLAHFTLSELYQSIIKHENKQKHGQGSER
jgi:hypothetical protein